MNTEPTAADHLLALLAVIKDPDAHKARLDELLAKEKAIDDKTAAFNEMHADTRRLHTAAEATTIVLTNRKTALDEREAELNERAKQLDRDTAAQKQTAQEASKKLQQREAEIARRESTLERREAAVKDMEAETKAALEKATATRDKLQRHAAAVSAAMAQ